MAWCVKQKINSTNCLERLNREIRRRTRVVGILDTCIRLVTCYMWEYTEDWITDRSYFSKESIIKVETVLKER